MATTLALGVEQNVTLSGTPGNMTRFDPPANARWLKITPRAYDVKFVRGGTDGDAIGASAYETLYAGTTYTIRVPGSGGGNARNIDSAAAASNSRRVCLASLTASVVVEIVALP